MSITKEYITLSIEGIIPYENNPRINDDAVAGVVESIKQCGELDPIEVDENNVILSGHTRLKAYNQLGYDKVSVLRVAGLTEPQKRKYRLLTNKTGEKAEWDFDKLGLELEGLDFDGFDFGFDVDLPNFEGEEDTPKEIIEDDYDEEPPVEPKAKLGDLWILGNNRLICGDSTDVTVIDRLMDGVKANMVFTDPPYGMNLDTDYSKMEGNGRKGKTYSKVIGDNEDFKDDLIKTVFDNFNYCKEIFLWGVDYYFDLIPNFKDGNLIVWDKTLQTNGDAGYNSEFELLWSKNQHKKEVIHFNWFRYFGLSAQDMKTREHPTQKPLQVITPFIEKYSKENDLIVDIYGGSGSTLIACEQLNRKCFMAELDPKYVSVIVNRWLNLTGRKDEIFCIRDGQKLNYDEVFN